MSEEIPAQLTLDGTEVPSSAVTPRRSAPPLTPTQRDVLAHIRETGSISPKQAGIILYGHQGSHVSRLAYASADGSEVLRRLALRGLIHKESRGRWVVGAGESPPPRRSEKRVR